MIYIIVHKIVTVSSFLKIIWCYIYVCVLITMQDFYFSLFLNTKWISKLILVYYLFAPLY